MPAQPLTTSQHALTQPSCQTHESPYRLRLVRPRGGEAIHEAASAERCSGTATCRLSRGLPSSDRLQTRYGFERKTGTQGKQEVSEAQEYSEREPAYLDNRGRLPKLRNGGVSIYNTIYQAARQYILHFCQQTDTRLQQHTQEKAARYRCGTLRNHEGAKSCVIQPRSSYRIVYTRKALITSNNQTGLMGNCIARQLCPSQYRNVAAPERRRHTSKTSRNERQTLA
jgi:hypothetical protein